MVKLVPLRQGILLILVVTLATILPIRVPRAHACDQCNFMLSWGTNGVPFGVAVDSSGNVYVVDGYNNRVEKFSNEGQYVTSFGSQGTGDGQFSYPHYIAVDSAGLVYVADAGNHRVEKFSSNGEYLTQWGTYGSGNGQFEWPLGITVDLSGYVYVADSANSRVEKFNGDGEYINRWGSQGSSPGQFNDPSAIAVDSSGNVYVLDEGGYNSRVEKFSSNGAYLTQWGSQGSGKGQFFFQGHPSGGIAVDSTGGVYVADTYNRRVEKFDGSGNYIFQWGSLGTGNGQFIYPEGIGLDFSDSVFVADSGNNRVEKFGDQSPSQYPATSVPVQTAVPMEQVAVILAVAVIVTSGATYFAMRTRTKKATPYGSDENSSRCIKCGTKLPLGAKFCDNCGANQPSG